MKKDNRKPILSCRIDADLLRRIDSLAQRAGTGRAEVVERCLLNGMLTDEEMVAWLKGTASGPLLQLLTHPTILKTLLEMLRYDLGGTMTALEKRGAYKRK